MNSWTENISSGRFLYIEDNSSDGGYEAKMAAAVSSPYLLAPAAVFAERKACFEYNISGLAGLDEYLAGRNLSAQDMTSLLTQIDTAAAVVQNYLLSESCMLINPDYIYVDKQKNELRICVVPEYGGCFEDELKEFIMKLLPYTDTDDVSAMRTCIKLMRAVSMHDYRLHDVLEMLNNSTATASRNTASGSTDMHGTGNSLYSGVKDAGSAVSYDKVSTAAYDSMQNLSFGRDAYGKETSGRDTANKHTANYASIGNSAMFDDIYDGVKQASDAYEYGSSNSASGNDVSANAAYDMSKSDEFASTARKNMSGKRKEMPKSYEDREDEIAGSPVKEGITGILISQAILAGIAVMVFFVKGKAVMLRLLPIYAVMAACLIIYYVISMIMKRRKAAE